jgi:transposase-like protein
VTQDSAGRDRLLGQLALREDEFVPRVVARIRTVLPHYLPVEPDGVDRLDVYCRRNLADTLRWLARRQLPGDTELDARRQDYARGARSGVAVTDVLRALRLGFQGLWLEMADVADRWPSDGAALPELTEGLWELHDVVATLATDAHARASQDRDLTRQREVVDLWSLLGRLPVSHPAAAAVARRLGLDPEGFFRAWAHRYTTLRRASAPAGTLTAHLRDVVVSFVPVETDHGDGSRFVAELRRIHSGAVGVGLARNGLAGLAQSALDARRALVVAEHRGLTLADFGDHWLAALGLDDGLGLDVLVRPVERLLNDDASLARALEVFLEQRGRLRSAARVLDVHPNTLAYRLQRYQDRTGIDPSSLSGSVITALALIRIRGVDQAG